MAGEQSKWGGGGGGGTRDTEVTFSGLAPVTDMCEDRSRKYFANFPPLDSGRSSYDRLEP